MIIDKEMHVRKKGLSDECCDIIEKMLNKDPAKRAGMFELIEHPWIEKYRKQT